jgi:hypothetical protein
MRKTLTLDQDVAMQLERLRRARNGTLKDLVNQALRRGLRDMSAPAKKHPAVRTRVFHMGKAAYQHRQHRRSARSY